MLVRLLWILGISGFLLRRFFRGCAGNRSKDFCCLLHLYSVSSACRPAQVFQVKIETSRAPDEAFFFFCSCVRPRWEIQQLMNVELVPSVSSDYLDLNLSSNKHSASRLGRHKPPFAASRLHQAVNWFIFSGRWNSSFSGRRRQWVQGEPGEEGGLEGGGRWGEVTFDDITF